MLTNIIKCIITVLSHLIQLVHALNMKGGISLIHLDYRDARPIYEQVKDGFRKLIIQGILQKDEKMPSVREMATSLTINPNTIQRAYRELEQEGYIYTVAGRGSFVAGAPDVTEEKQKELLKNFDQLVEELLYTNISKDMLIERIQNKGGRDS